MLNEVDILGVRVRSGPVHEVVAHIDRGVRRREDTRVAFLNAHLSNVCSADEALRDRLDGFLVLNDGVGLDIARRVLHGRPFAQNLNGTDFVTAYLDRSAHDLRLFLVGARPEVIARAAGRIARRWPRHAVVGFRDGYVARDEEPALTRAIAAARPDLILVGMGNPRQESWIAAHVPGLCACAIAVGAWFDFVAGAVPRAPAWMRRARLEWVFRLWIEPRRLARRYLVGNGVFLARLALARARRARLQSG